VVEEERLARVKVGDAGHLVLVQLEVEYVEVLAQTLRPDRLRDHDDVALREPTQNDLSN
jgi:hypothetical protein